MGRRLLAAAGNKDIGGGKFGTYFHPLPPLSINNENPFSGHTMLYYATLEVHLAALASSDILDSTLDPRHLDQKSDSCIYRHSP